jgi:glycosyltransferase involved in cell wall biosynthesis
MAQIAQDAGSIFSRALRRAARDRGVSGGANAGQWPSAAKNHHDLAWHGHDLAWTGSELPPGDRARSSHSDAITTVSESLRGETLATFAIDRPVEVIHNFFVPSRRTRTREEVRAELGIAPNEFLVVHISNVRPLKRIDLLLRAFAAARSSRPLRLLIVAGSSFAPYEPLLDELAYAGG